MSRVFIPRALQRLTGGVAEVESRGGTVRAIVDDLEERFPGIRARLCDEDRLRTGLTVVIGTAMAGSNLLQPVPPGSEVHFVQSVGGG